MVATKSQMGRPKKDEPTDRIRMPASVIRRIKRIAAHLDLDPGDWVAQAIETALDRAEAKMVKEIEEAKGEAEGQ